eukprot:Trichotokara_eunicae@DN4087_c0_g1_i1.p1
MSKRITRDYQMKIFENVKNENMMAVLPTNGGKTLIASLLVNYYLEQEQFFDKIVLFLVPTTVIATQQETKVIDDIAELLDKTKAFSSKVLTGAASGVDEDLRLDWGTAKC